MATRASRRRDNWFESVARNTDEKLTAAAQIAEIHEKFPDLVESFVDSLRSPLRNSTAGRPKKQQPKKQSKKQPKPTPTDVKLPNTTGVIKDLLAEGDWWTIIEIADELEGKTRTNQTGEKFRKFISSTVSRLVSTGKLKVDRSQSPRRYTGA